MKKFFTCGIAAMFIAGSSINTQAAERHSSFIKSSGIYFEENKGQIKDQHWHPRPDVLFSGNANGMNYFLRKDGLSYQLVKQEISADVQQLPLEERMKKINETPVEIYRVDVNWKNTNKNFSIEKGKAFNDVNNYYNVPVGMQPALGVKKYEEVWLRNIWTGVDMHYFSRNGVLESDWVLARAANYTNIAFEIKGAELSVEGNELVMKTPFGTIREGALKSFQEGKEIATKWNIEGKTVRLQLENFNPEKPITIDPPTRVWGTYYGGASDDRILSIATDTSNNVVATGFTFSTGAIATTGAHQTTLAGGNDAFVVKFNSNGVRQWGTYFGGASGEVGRGICTNAGGFVFVAGSTLSPSGIATTGAQQTTHANTGSNDAFLVMFDPNGTRIWGTYYGGNGADEGNACAIDGSTVYLAGTTASATGIATITPGINNGNAGTPTDAFLVKFNVSTALRIWGRYVGGANNEEGNACTVDASGNVYVGGASSSINYFANSASNPAYASNVINGSVFDVFVAKYNTSGAAIWSGTLGSTTIDRIRGLATDAQKNLIAVGTFGGIVSSFATPGAHQTTFGGGSDAFIIKSDSAGNRLWRTYYGSNFNEEAYGCAVSSTGRIMLVSAVATQNAALFTTGAHQTTYGGGAWDANAAVFTPSGSLNYATYYGGSLIDEGLSGAFDKTGAFYFGGFTSSTSAISTVGSHQETFGTNIDGFLVKFAPPVCSSPGIIVTATPSDSICLNNSVTLSAQVSSGDFLWQPGGQTTSSITVTPTTTTTYSVSVTDNDGCVSTGSKTIVIRPLPTAPTNITGPDTICNFAFVNYKAFGAQNVNFYNWTITGNANIQSQAGDSVRINATAAGTFTLTATAFNNCGSAQFSKQFVVVPAITPNISPINAAVCQGESITLTASGGSPNATYTWSNGLGTGANKTVSPTSTTTYTVTISNGGACVNFATRTVTVNTPPTASISPATVTICNGESTTLTASGNGNYNWSNGLGSSATVTVSPSANTTYTVTVTASNGCTATASRLVTVNPSPTASISPATVTICSGESATLTASGGGTYAWSNSGGSNAAATFTPASTTTYTVTVTANGCTATASRTVTVNPSPMVSISPATVAICNGESATLTASGGGTYAWSNSGGSNASATFTPTTSTTYTVTVTSANNCTATASRLVTVNANPTASISPASPSICNGASLTLTASGGTTYSWSNGLGSGASKTVSPTSTTTYTVTVTNAANCTATASATVTVNTVNASINGPTTICSGLPATLTASGGTGYAWSNGGGTNAQATFSPTSTTTYTVTVTGAGGCTATASQTVSVQSQPTASISGPTEVCNGSSVTLTANGGNTYTWANGLGTNAAITVSPTTTTTYTVTVSIGANCTATATKTVTVKQPSASSLAETICFGNSYTFKNQQLTQSGTYRDTLTNAAGCDSVITLNLTVRPKVESTVNAAICAGQSYAFNNQQLTQAGQYFDTLQTTLGCDSFITLNLTVNSFVTGSTSASICQGQSYTFNGQQLTQAGQYLDTLTSAGGCDSILTLTLTVNPLPQPTITQNGNQLSTQSFNSYQWQLNGNNINGATNQNYTATQNGSYTVVVTNANGCSNTSGAVNVTGVGISEILDFRSVIYPNPASTVLNIESEEELEAITVTDLVGREIFIQSKIQNLKSKIDVSGLAEATYFIHIKTTKGKTAVKTFVKQ